MNRVVTKQYMKKILTWRK